MLIHWRDRIFIFLILLLCTQLVGCVPPNYLFNPNKNQIEADNDFRECEYEALKFSSPGSGRNEALYNKCLETRGYSWVNSITIINKGNELYRKGQYRESLPYYDRAAYDFPREKTIYLNMGSAYYELKQYQRAESHFEKALSIDPKYSLAVTGKAWCTLKSGKIDAAKAGFEKAMELEPESPYPFIGRGYYYLEKKKLDAALSDLDKAISLHSGPYEIDLQDAYYYRGLVYKKKGNLEPAIQDLKKSCDLGQRDGCIEYKKLSRL